MDVARPRRALTAVQVAAARIEELTTAPDPSGALRASASQARST